MQQRLKRNISIKGILTGCVRVWTAFNRLQIGQWWALVNTVINH
jgi:hypothetical protein